MYRASPSAIEFSAWFGFLASGSAAYAEYVAAPASDLALKPAGIDHVHAAGAPMSGLTAWQFLIELGHNEPNPLQPEMHRPVPLDGKTVLVNGAAGGVGHFAVQLAKWKGAHVIAVASGTQESFLRELGADEFIDYTKSAPEDVAHDVDLVLDTSEVPPPVVSCARSSVAALCSRCSYASPTPRRPRNSASRSR